jgi:hypothetical protein
MIKRLARIKGNTYRLSWHGWNLSWWLWQLKQLSITMNEI